MSAQADDYDKLTKEEREARDTADREREAAEQAALPYTWKQELGEVDIVVPVPKGTRARDLGVVIQKKKLSVGLKGKEPIMSGELCKDVKVEDSTWTVEDQEAVHIHLEKVNKQQWWENVLTHHPKIDTTKIQPENSKLSDLDGETRGMVEKMMFDNQQRQMGKPTSDELKKMEALKKFQEAHPELDFSNAKIS
ncbi:nuclear movement protein nudC [Obba rivulosa]|uniref:Nuclear movement protein nudC n=1 Tax=Obba rivulosa TaxID=1052685 RepID=A0A8E2DUH1_9APHY|nr:nuclear movement protein nudC [Obba rivulosa]